MIAVPSLSVAVCTRDRAASLVHTLGSLAAAATHACGDWELLVVDNGSSDDTAAVAHGFAPRLPGLRLLSEPQAGLSRARNRALAEFRGDWLAFTDDDALVAPQWLAALQAAIRDPREVDFLGGRSQVRWPSSAPAWLRRNDAPFISGLLCHYDLGEVDRDYESGDELPIGVNMAVSRRLVESVGTFRIDLGAGTGARGEDSEYLKRAVDAGLRGRYLASATVHHTADRERLTLPALYRHGVAKGRTHARMNDRSVGGASRFKEAAILARAALQGLLRRGENLRIGVINAGILHGLRAERRRG